MKKWLIYQFETPDGALYIGATCDVARRMREHRRWLGHRPEYVVLEECDGSWRDAEHKHIQAARERGARLANKTDGRNGNEGLSPESRAKLSASIKGRPKSAEHAEKIGASQRGVSRNWSDDGREAVKATQFRKGRKLSDADREIALRNLENGRDLTSEERSRRNRLAWANATPEQRAARAAAIRAGQERAGVFSVEQVAKRTAKLTGRTLSPEHKAKIRAATQSPEVRAKMAASQKARRERDRGNKAPR